MKINETKKRRKKKTPCNSMSYTTGDISLNIGRFNQAMGTAEGSEVGIGGEGSLCEAKRYVRRYYIRPQNIFCSNKAEILKALIELDDANCSVYTLNNLGDEKDVSKLMNSDIIYYYDDGILYDKNRIKVMDYDLSIKKEEERKKFANADKAPEKDFKAAYDDRLTKVTEFEESFNAFDLDFDDVNVYGEKLTEAKTHNCCICGEQIDGAGEDPSPYKEEGKACEGCFVKFVLPLKSDLM